MSGPGRRLKNGNAFVQVINICNLIILIILRCDPKGFSLHSEVYILCDKYHIRVFIGITDIVRNCQYSMIGCSFRK